jgi:hypothetical protein
MAYNTNQWSISRNGLVNITYISNVRNMSYDVRRKQVNELRRERQQGEMLINDQGQQYTALNSDVNFNIDQGLTPQEIFEALNVANLRMILNTYRIPIIGTPIKAQLVQMITNAVQQQPSRLNYIKQVLTQQLNESRRQQPNQRQTEVTLHISNKHRYSKSDFDGMKFKDILRSLFNMDYHDVFLYERVLKGKRNPISIALVTERLLDRANKIINKTPGMNDQEIEDVKDRLFEKESTEADIIQKHNTDIVLQLLFAPKRPFYINKKKYTILGFQQEDKPSPYNDDGIVMGTLQQRAYAILPVKVYIDLSESSPEKISDKEIQQTSCHLRSEKIRKDWFDIWNTPSDPATPPQDIFERKHRKTIKQRPVIQGGKTRKKIMH